MRLLGEDRPTGVRSEDQAYLVRCATSAGVDQPDLGVLDIWQAYAEHAEVKSCSHIRVTCSLRRECLILRNTVPAFLASAEKSRGQLRAVESLTRTHDLAARLNQRDLRELAILMRDTITSDHMIKAGLLIKFVLTLRYCCQAAYSITVRDRRPSKP